MAVNTRCREYSVYIDPNMYGFAVDPSDKAEIRKIEDDVRLDVKNPRVPMAIRFLKLQTCGTCILNPQYSGHMRDSAKLFQEVTAKCTGIDLEKALQTGIPVAKLSLKGNTSVSITTLNQCPVPRAIPCEVFKYRPRR